MYICKIQKDITEEFIKILNEFKILKLDTSFGTCTKNGFQTSNILEYPKYKNLKNVMQNILPKKYDLFHIHLIEYFINGYQEGHNHIKTEKYSFILYLNDCNTGHTVFNNNIKVKPEKNKLILFDSDIWHYSEVCLTNKQVAVGAMN